MRTAEDRRAVKDRMPQTELELRHTWKCRVLPHRNALLDLLPKDGLVAEIGVAFGRFSAEILKRTRPRELHLIDAWEGDRYGAGLAEIEARFRNDISDGRVRIHRGNSVDVLRALPPDSFDWVYIDTNHKFETTAEELRLCESLVRDGGQIAGHDFCTGNVIDAIPYGVVEAVTAFCKERDWCFRYLTVESRGHFSFSLQRIQNA